jgi:hypothetical protein
LLLKGKNSAMSEFELLLQHAPPDVREKHLEQCRHHGVALSCFKDDRPTETLRMLPSTSDAVLDARPRHTTPAKPLPNRFASPNMQLLLERAQQHMQEVATREPDRALIEQHTESEALTEQPASVEAAARPIQAYAAQAAVRPTQRQEDGWELKPISEDGNQEPASADLVSTRQPAATAGPAVSSRSRDEDPYPDGGSYTPTEQPGAHQASGGEQPADTNVGPSPRISQPDTSTAWQSTQLNAYRQPNMLPFAFSGPTWHSSHPFLKPPAQETRSVYRTDDGYVHISVSVLKAAQLWDESWDASDGSLFLQHVTRLDARHRATQEQLRVLEGHRDALAKDRALHRYTNVSSEITELQQQIAELRAERAADKAASTKAEAVVAADVTLLRNSMKTVTDTQETLSATQKTLQIDVAQVQASSTTLEQNNSAMHNRLQALSNKHDKTATTLSDLSLHTRVFAEDAEAAIAAVDNDMHVMSNAINAYCSRMGAADTMEHAAELMDQVTRIQGQILAVTNPRRDVWLASIADRIQRTDAMQQDYALQMGALRKSVETLEDFERDFRHVPGEVTAMYKHQKANADSILTTWVHIQRLLSHLQFDWRASDGMPSDEDLPIQYVARVPDVDPEESGCSWRLWV